MQLLVLGMHRSGTSALTRVLNLMGASLGEGFEELGENEANPKGYWERTDFAVFDQELLEACGKDWYYLADIEKRLVEVGHQERRQQKARQMLAKLDQHSPWVVKDPRMSVLMPFWRPLLSRPVVIITYRDPIEIAESLARRDRLPLDFGVALWFETVRRCLRDVAGLPLVWVGHQQLLREPMATITRLLEDLRRVGVTGLEMPDPAAVADFLDLSLYRARRQDTEDIALSPAQLQLWQLQQSEPPRIEPNQLPQPDLASRWAEHYGALLQAYGGPFWTEKRQLREAVSTLLPALQEDARTISEQLIDVRNSLAGLHEGIGRQVGEQGVQNQGALQALSFLQKSASGLHEGLGVLQNSASGLHDGLGQVLMQIANQQRTLDVLVDQLADERAKRTRLEAQVDRYRTWAAKLSEELQTMAKRKQSLAARLGLVSADLASLIARVGVPPDFDANP